MHNFLEIRVSIGELKTKLNSSEMAALAVSSYCANEVNNFTKLGALTDFGVVGNQVVDWHNRTLQSGVFRALTVRLLDFWKFLRKCEKQNGDVGSIAQGVASQFSLVEDMIGHEVAKAIRDKSAAHASFDDAKQVLKNVDDWIEASFILHEDESNSIYSLGEEAYTYGLLKGLIDDNHTYDDLLECWYDWIKYISSALTVFHVRLMDSLVSERFGDRMMIKHSVLYPHERMADATIGHRLPTFVKGTLP